MYMFSFLLWHKIELDSVKMSQNMSNKTRKFIAEYEFGAFTMLVDKSKFQATFSTSNLTIKSKGGILAKAYEHILELHQKCGLSEQHYNKEDVEELLQERNQLKNEASFYKTQPKPDRK